MSCKVLQSTQRIAHADAGCAVECRSHWEVERASSNFFAFQFTHRTHPTYYSAVSFWHPFGPEIGRAFLLPADLHI